MSCWVTVQCGWSWLFVSAVSMGCADMSVLMIAYVKGPKVRGPLFWAYPKTAVESCCLYLFPQCSPWPDVAYQVNSAPSPSCNGSPNSFGLGEGYVQPFFPWGPGMQWGRGSCLSPLPSSHGLASIWVLVWLTGLAIAAIFIYSLSDPHVGLNPGQEPYP